MTTTSSLPDSQVLAAFDTAKKDFNRQLKDKTVPEEIQKTTSIDEVYVAIKRLQDEQGNRGCLRNLHRINTYLQRLNEFAGVLDTFVQAKPDILALIWGPIKLLIHVSSNVVKSLDAILDAMHMIGDKLPIFKEYEKLFDANPRVIHVLVLIFRDILDFHLAALNFFALKGWRIAFEALWPTHRDKFEFVASNLEKHDRLMVSEVTLAHISKAHDEWSAARKHYDEETEARDYNYFRTIERHVEPKMYDDRLDQLHMSICDGTGAWLEKDETFKQWLDPTEKSVDIVWLQGLPGAGKTYISSRVIDHAKETSPTLFVFLRYDEEVSTLSILHSLIFQLVSLNTNLRAAFCNELRSVNRDLTRDLKGSTKFATDILLKLIQCEADPVYVVVDGLDEVDQHIRQLILLKLLDLKGEVGEDSRIKLFISSRREENIERHLRDIAKIIHLDKKNSGCIQKYVAQETRSWLIRENFDSETCAEIKGLLAFLPVDVEGMFLYARIVMSTIQMLPPEVDLIRQELIVPPKNLHDAYQRILQRINDMPEAAKTISKRVLSYIACSPMPITTYEMEHLMLLDPDKFPEEIPRVLAPMNVLKHCGPLVEVVQDKLRFVHFTVREYLTADLIQLTSARIDLTETCLKYLSMELFKGDAPEEYIERGLRSGYYRLCNFATSQWFSLLRLNLRDSLSGLLPDRLLSTLVSFILERGNPDYKQAIGPGVAKIPEPIDLQPVEQSSVKSHAFLCQMADFTKKKYEAGNWRLIDGDTWIKMDSTTLSSSLASIHTALEKLLLSKSGDEQSHGFALESHYGPQLFRCDYILCPFNKIGFKTKSDRDAHTAHHERPFKCAEPDCDFAVIGFLSQKQSDDHWFLRHGDSLSVNEFGMLSDLLNGDERFTLLSRLVAMESLPEVRLLLEKEKKMGNFYNSEIVKQHLRRIATSGSVDMFRLLESNIIFTQAERKEFLVSATKGENYPIQRYLIEKYQFTCEPVIMASDSADLFDMWASEAAKHNSLWVPFITISPVQALRLAAFWEVHPALKTTSQIQLSMRLRSIAEFSCSVELAKVLVGAGADINYNLNSQPDSPTPLHYAARKTSREAAELAKYLLLCGANPNIGTTARKGRKKGQLVFPAMERGACNIQQWLAMSWDELVNWAKEEISRKEREVQPEEESGKGEMVGKL